MSSTRPRREGSLTQTPLMAAVRNGHRKITQLLVGRGADVNRATNKGYTALHLATGRGKTAILVALLQGGADLDRRDNEGTSALGFAISSGALSSARELLSRGASVSLDDLTRWILDETINKLLSDDPVLHKLLMDRLDEEIDRLAQLADVSEEHRVRFAAAARKLVESFSPSARKLFVPEGYRPFAGVREDGPALEYLAKWWGPHIQAGKVVSRQNIREVDQRLLLAVYEYARATGTSLDGLLPPARPREDLSGLSAEEKLARKTEQSSRSRPGRRGGGPGPSSV